MRLYLLLAILFFSQWSIAQPARIKSGPMLGYAEMREVLIWVQMTKASEVWAEYFSDDAKHEKFRTAKIITTSDNAYTAKLIAADLKPGTQYTYQIMVNGKPEPGRKTYRFKTQPLWQWRMDPPDFTLVTGSCNYVNETEFDRPGKPYGDEHHIFESIRLKKPDLMLWLGDNVYLREADWNSQSGIYHRYSHTRALPELQGLLAATHHYAIWDDHDYGPNDSDRTYVHKATTRKAFIDFWGNPTFGMPGLEGVTTAFQWADIDFFLLDNRWDRTPNDCEKCDPTILGKAQREWLIQALSASRAPFKIVAVGGQFLSPVAKFENFSNRHAPEREWILKRIEEENIQGVIFLSGDLHHTELSAFQNGMGNMIYDLTTSALTAGPVTRNENVGNTFRVTDTYVNVRNFSTLTFSGKRNQRSVLIENFNSNGELLWQYLIESPGKK